MKAISRLFDFLYEQKERYPLEQCMGEKVDGRWTFYSTEQVILQAESLASGMIAAGWPVGSRIGIVSYQNSPAWVITDLAIQLAGLVSIPLYPTISPREYAYILKEAEVTAVFMGPGDLYEKIHAVRQEVPSLKHLYTFDHHEAIPSWNELLEAPSDAMRHRQTQVTTDDLFTIIYTSGTTGNPKGVMLSHSNVLNNVQAVAKAFPTSPGDRVLSFLPLAHVFERAATYAFILVDLSIHFTGIDNLGGEEGDLRQVKPHFFTCVPRLLEKVYEKIYDRGSQLTGIKKKLFFWSLDQTEKYAYDYPLSGWKAWIADRLVFSKWREALGGQVKGIVTGAAPCPQKILQVFSAAGIPVREAYGLTEASPGISVNLFEPYQALIGSVGPALENVEIRIDTGDSTYLEGTGEVLVCGPNVMLGYYKNIPATRAVLEIIDGKTWLRTGDIGTMVSNEQGTQFLKITDRKKELFKTSGGKYVAPAPIESRFKEDPFIEQIMVVGDQQRFVSAIILPARENVLHWAGKHGLEDLSYSELLAHPQLLALFSTNIDRINLQFSHTEQIKQFILSEDTWETVKSDGTEGELTPTLKLKRRVILDKYRQQIEAIYA